LQYDLYHTELIRGGGVKKKNAAPDHANLNKPEKTEGWLRMQCCSPRLKALQVFEKGTGSLSYKS
jgi:hypothetical protein